VTVTAQAGASYTYVAADRSTCVTRTNAGAITDTIPDVGGSNFQFGYSVCVINIGATTDTVSRTAASTINGGTTLAIAPNQAAYFYSDPANNWRAVLVPTNGGTSALSGITAATGANTIANANNPQTWNWAQTTDAQDGIAFGETSAATGGTLTGGLANQADVAISTATNSTATPLEVTQGTLSGSVATPAMQIEATWNNGATTFNGFLMNVTDTARGGASCMFKITSLDGNTFCVDAAENLVTHDTYVDGLLTIGGGGPGSPGDTGLSRESAGVVDFGNGTQGNVTGTIKPAKYATGTNCAVNSVSPAACASAASGVFAIPASQTTYTVNTTAVTANSRIFLQPVTDNTGIPSAPTCVSPSVTADTTQASRVAGTSFTITLSTIASITCYNYWIVN
jgi:hypothetical protein